MRIARKAIGKRAVFHGFDGKDYDCVIARVNNGVVVIDYAVGGQLIRGFVDSPSHSRIEIPAESA